MQRIIHFSVMFSLDRVVISFLPPWEMPKSEEHSEQCANLLPIIIVIKLLYSMHC